jgi:hypothetical protein
MKRVPVILGLSVTAAVAAYGVATTSSDPAKAPDGLYKAEPAANHGADLLKDNGDGVSHSDLLKDTSDGVSHSDLLKGDSDGVSHSDLLKGDDGVSRDSF